MVVLATFMIDFVREVSKRITQAVSFPGPGVCVVSHSYNINLAVLCYAIRSVYVVPLSVIEQRRPHAVLIKIHGHLQHSINYIIIIVE